MKNNLIALIGLIISSCATHDKLDVVEHVDLQKYLGTWYEIARLPAWFEEGCFGVTATYSMREDGKIKVINSCRKGSMEGTVKNAVGKAWVVDKATNAKLKVMFFWPFAGNYWIIDLDQKEYRYAVVGEPSRKYLWVLSRTPNMDEILLNKIFEKVKKQGYNLEGLIKTVQVSK